MRSSTRRSRSSVKATWTSLSTLVKEIGWYAYVPIPSSHSFCRARHPLPQRICLDRYSPFIDAQWHPIICAILTVFRPFILLFFLLAQTFTKLQSPLLV